MECKRLLLQMEKVKSCAMRLVIPFIINNDSGTHGSLFISSYGLGPLITIIHFVAKSVSVLVIRSSSRLTPTFFQQAPPPLTFLSIFFYFLAPQDFPGSVHIFPAFVLESATTPRIPGPFN